MKITRIFEDENGTAWQQSWGYCHENNARVIGYAANILAAVLGLVLLCLGRKVGLDVVFTVGMSFCFAWVAESFPRNIWRPSFVVFSAVATVASYIIALGA